MGVLGGLRSAPLPARGCSAPVWRPGDPEPPPGAAGTPTTRGDHGVDGGIGTWTLGAVLWGARLCPSDAMFYLAPGRASACNNSSLAL